ncbi:MAG: helix-turn-helix domain-containing protein [bacterium]|nr:helix-turn-helix domain-containing protein [bacterium]
MTEQLLTAEQATEYLQISRRTLFRLIKNGKLRALKVGNAYRFKKAELEEDLRVNTGERRMATR